MIGSRLAIPLQETHLTRQRIWRVLRVIGLLLVGAVVGVGAFRAILFHNRAVAWPKDAVAAVRILKTPENITNAERFSQALVSDVSPQSIGRELLASRHEIIIFLTSAGESAGFATDHDGHLATFAPELEAKRRVFAPWLLWPTYDGSLILKGDKLRASPLTLTATSATLRGDFSAYGADSHLSLAAETPLLAAGSAPAGLATSLLPSVPAVFPGLQSLHQALTQGFSGLLGTDTQGLAYALELPMSSFSPEELGAITKELAQTSHLSTQDWTIGALSFDELRGNTVNVEITHDNDLDRVVARGTEGEFVRATQANGILILSNRESDISPTAGKKMNPCLPKATGLLAPAQLLELLTAPALYEPQNVSDLTRGSSLVAWSKTQFRLCW